MVGRGVVCQFAKPCPLAMEDNDVPEPRPPLSSLNQRLEERSGRFVKSPVVPAGLPLWYGDGVCDDADAGDDIKPLYAGDGVEVAKNVFLAQ